jgi:para-nitrobenzyl esterase
MRNFKVLFLILFLSACAIQQSNSSKLETKQIASFSEKYIGNELNNSLQWLGIPYAQPPEGSLRWKAPRALKKNDKQIKAFDFGNPCPQLASISIDRREGGEYIGSEDCLYLNVFTPKNLDSNKKLPVMFWIHGGGNTSGEAGVFGLVLSSFFCCNIK